MLVIKKKIFVGNIKNYNYFFYMISINGKFRNYCWLSNFWKVLGYIIKI